MIPAQPERTWPTALKFLKANPGYYDIKAIQRMTDRPVTTEDLDELVTKGEAEWRLYLREPQWRAVK